LRVWRGALASIVGIGLYTLLVGADEAVARAAILGGFSVFAKQIGCRQDSLNSQDRTDYSWRAVVGGGGAVAPVEKR